MPYYLWHTDRVAIQTRRFFAVSETRLSLRTVRIHTASVAYLPTSRDPTDLVEEILFPVPP